MLRAELQRNHTFTDNLGVGDFDLAERGYSQTRNENVLRASIAGVDPQVAVQRAAGAVARGRRSTFAPTSTAPAVLVLNAFDTGGAQIAGARGVARLRRSPTISTSRSAGTRSATGLQLEAGRYRTDERRNAGGTFTFAEPGRLRRRRARRRSRETSATRRVAISQAQLGLYVQDDYPRAERSDAQRRRPPGIPVAHRRPPPRAARRHRVVAVQERQDDDSRRRRHLLRLVRRAGLRAGRAARRHASADRNDRAARLSRCRARRPGAILPAGRVQFADGSRAAAAARDDRRRRADSCPATCA